MSQYYILTLDPRAGEVFKWIMDRDIPREVHLNRTRFWVPEGVLYTEFQLRFSDCCPQVDVDKDLLTGQPK